MQQQQQMGQQQQMMQQQQQMMHMQQLESEIARLQVELRQVRQMIGALMRFDQENRQAYDEQRAGQGGQNFNNPHYVAEERRIAGQYDQMLALADQMNQQLQDVSHFAGPQAARWPNPEHRMNVPRNNDPMQQIY
jgi:hypothetical protein